MKLPSLAKPKSQFPIRAIDGNILFGRGDGCVAVYRLNTLSYPFLSKSDKMRKFQHLARALAALEADFSLYRVSRAYPASDYAEQALTLLDPVRGDELKWRSFLTGHAEHLEKLRPFVPEVYVAVSLVPAKAIGLGSGVLDRTAKVRQRAGVGERKRLQIKQTELSAREQREELMFGRLKSYVGVERATVRDIQWLLRRTRCRGLGEPRIDPHWRPAAIVVKPKSSGDVPALQPLETDIVRHVNAPLREQDRVLPVQSEEGLSYQAMLGVGAMPEAAQFPGGAELLFTPLERVPFPVDAVLHAKYITNREAVTRVRRKIVDADIAYAGQVGSMHGAMSWALEENRTLARDLDAYLTSDAHPPLYEVAMSLALGAESTGELEHRIEALQAAYGNIELHHPIGLQEGLFLDHLLRTDGGAVRDYADVMTIEQIAAMMPIGTHDAGDTVGVHFARTTSYGGRPVKIDITRPPRSSLPPAIYMSGGLGSGKTVFAELLDIIAALRGSRVLTVDPKGDHRLHLVPELAGMVEVVHPTGEEKNRGMLDPMMIAPVHMREDRAVSTYLELMGDIDSSWQTQIKRATKAVLEGPNPCSLRVVETLLKSEHEDARKAGEAMEVTADSGLARLVFGNGEKRKDHGKPITVISPRDLMLPDSSTARASYDPIEKISVVIMKLIAVEWDPLESTCRHASLSIL